MAAEPKVTLEDFLHMEETKPYSEFANGAVFQKAGADWPHAAIQSFLITALFEFQQRTHLGQTLPSCCASLDIRERSERTYRTSYSSRKSASPQTPTSARHRTPQSRSSRQTKTELASRTRSTSTC